MTPRLLGNKPDQHEWIREQFARQSTIPISTIDPSIMDSAPPTEPSVEDSSEHSLAAPPENGRKKYIARAVAVILMAILATLLFVTWQPLSANQSSSPNITKQSFMPVATSTAAQTDTASDNATSDTIQVYIVGAVKHPGVYTLPADARVYQLLQAAGGPKPNANLVALNLAARLHDGQEIYVTVAGEKQPNTSGSTSGTSNPADLVNVNTATVDELMQKLHVSSTTAHTIIDYRTQHGPYESIEQLATVVSKSIYDKIKEMVTV
ncbi:MAG: ComEA family DNA-binding protein [Ktedonobacteraceae bacterium]|nr:ComEA family DNA-binding protein [Ktedonobacteraceae bacterium]